MEIAISSDFSQTLFQEIIFVTLFNCPYKLSRSITKQSTLSVNVLQKETAISSVKGSNWESDVSPCSPCSPCRPTYV